MLLYIIAPSRRGPCKIGYAGRPRKRLTSLQIGNPLDLSLCSVWHKPDDRSMVQCERIIHHALGRSHIRGEWFSVSVVQAEQACRDAGMTQAIESNGEYDFARAPAEGDDRLSWLV